MIETAYKLLVVDDDKEVLIGIVEYFRRAGFEVTGVLDGKTALDMLTRDTVDLLITDLKLPGIDGLELATRVRRTLPDIPIILLTAADPIGVEVLRLGDYFPKPFSLRELEARVKILLRSKRAGGEDSPIRNGWFSIDPAKREVTVRARPVKLTREEFDLLWLLASNPGRTFPRHYLLEEVWGNSYEGRDRTVDSYINRLRAKIEGNPDDPRMLLTVWGVGYKFSDE